MLVPKPPCFCKQKHFVTESILFWGISWPFPWPEVFMYGLGREKEGECMVERIWGCLTSVSCLRWLISLVALVEAGRGWASVVQGHWLWGGWLLDDNHYFQQRWKSSLVLPGMYQRLWRSDDLQRGELCIWFFYSIFLSLNLGKIDSKRAFKSMNCLYVHLRWILRLT